jgi:hypothetical protein
MQKKDVMSKKRAPKSKTSRKAGKRQLWMPMFFIV